MKAIPVSFEISVNFECNGCGEILTLYNREVQSRIGRKTRCGGCNKFIDIPMMDINVSELKSKPKQDNGNKSALVKVLKNYGYAPDEIKQMLSSIKDFTKDVSVLLKVALASKEQE